MNIALLVSSKGNIVPQITNTSFQILNLICFIWIIIGRFVDATIAFLAAAVSGFCITGIFSLIHFFNRAGKLFLLLLKLEMIYAFLWGVYYMAMAPFILIIGGFPYIPAGVSMITVQVVKMFHLLSALLMIVVKT